MGTNNSENNNGLGTSSRMKRRDRGLLRCHKCDDNYKPNRAHHDSVTGRCIVKMDHFCPWVGNAVGALNHKFFVLFIFYTMCTTLLSLLLLLMRAIYCGHYVTDDSDSTDIASKALPVRGISGQNPQLVKDALLGANYEVQECNDLYSSKLILLLLIVSFAFFIFTSCMLFEQLEAIQTNTGKIARMKMRVGAAGSAEYRPVTEEFNEMFGGTSPRPTWHWFIPTKITFPRSMKTVLLGYEWDESFEALPYEEPNITHNSNNANKCCITTDHNSLKPDDDCNNHTTTVATDCSTISPTSSMNKDDQEEMEDVLLTTSSVHSGSGSDVESGLQQRQQIKKRSNSRNGSEIV